MGMTKALAEKVAQAAARLCVTGDTVVAAVRYGNVLCSRGSVVPLFVRQIRAGGPVTVTDRSMTRFLLSLPEALELVLYALGHAHPGDLFVKKAPACTIGDLSKALRHLLDADVSEEVIGVRHGEKLFETLATREELSRAEDHGDYYRIAMDDRDLNYGKYFSEGTSAGDVVDDYTSHNTALLSVAEVQQVLASLPEVQAQMAMASGRCSR
jgi:UDP-glucose 4-epimerase